MAGVRDYLRGELRRDVRMALYFACCTAGGLLGLWQGMLGAPVVAPDPHFWTALADVMRPVLVGVGLGVAAGVLLAAAISLSLQWLRPSRGRL
jgi:hypothetical protein